MAVPTNSETSYNAAGGIGGGVREQLADFIANISPTDTPFTAAIGTMEANNTYFEWLTDSLAAASTTNAQLEGDDLTGIAVVQPVRIGNRCQISTKGIIVTGTAEAVKKAGRNSEMAYEIRKRTLELKRDVESTSTQNNASVTGSISVARQTGGLESWFATNALRGTGGANGGFSAGTVSAPTDGTQRAFTETLLKTLYQSVWNAGGNPTMMMLGGLQKQNMSTFTGNATRMDDSSDRKLYASIDIYESDFGAVKVVPNRFQRNRTAFLLQPDMWKLAFLRPYQIKDIAPTGDSVKKEVIVEWGVCSMNEAASGVIADLI